MTSGSLHDASWLVTDRTAGASQGAFAFGNLAVHVGDDSQAVAANRAALADRVGVPQVVFTRAAHSRTVAHVNAMVPDVPDTDGLVTDRPGLALAAQGADCAMIGIATADGWIAAVHCGWQGLVRAVVAAAMEAMAGAGSTLEAPLAHVGPAICARCYPVDPARAEQVAAVAVGGGAGWHDPASGIPYVATDDHAIGSWAAEHLMDCGFTNFAFCGYPATRTNLWAGQRRDAFVGRLARSGFHCDVFTGRHTTALHWEQLQRDLALVLARCGLSQPASMWLDRYLKNNPDDPQRNELTQLLDVLK